MVISPQTFFFFFFQTTLLVMPALNYSPQLHAVKTHCGNADDAESNGRSKTLWEGALVGFDIQFSNDLIV